MKKKIESYVAVNGQFVVHVKHGKFETSNAYNVNTGKVDSRLIRRYGFGSYVVAGQPHVIFYRG